MTAQLQDALADAVTAMRRAQLAGTVRALGPAVLAAEQALEDATKEKETP